MKICEVIATKNPEKQRFNYQQLQHYLKLKFHIAIVNKVMHLFGEKDMICDYKQFVDRLNQII